MAFHGDMYQQTYHEDSPPPYHPSALKQWVHRIISYSSQYDNAGWSADQVIGRPRVYPQYGDLHGAWASSAIDSHQFIELEFEVPVKPTAINIYETYHPGAVVSVKAKDRNSQWLVLWKANRATALTSSRIFSPPLAEIPTGLTVNQIRLELDCNVSRSWCEIDAVELVGIRPGAVMPTDDTDYFEEIGSLVNNKLHSDVQLHIDDKKVYGHKAILAVRSPFFAKMFSKEKNEKMTLKLPNISKEDLVTAFTFLYTNKLPARCSVETLIKLCKTSETFEVMEMKTAAVYKLMTGSMACDNVIPIFLMAVKDKSLDEIKSMCIKFMADNLKEMSRIPDFETLPQKYLVEIVQNATANMTMNS